MAATKRTKATEKTPAKRAAGKQSRRQIGASEPRYTPRRRDAKRTPELEELILERVAAGESLRKVCEASGMPDPATVRYWAVHDLGFGARLTAARVCQAHEWFDLIREELDRPLTETEDGKKLARGDSKRLNAEVQLRRLRIDTYKWGLSKLLPQNFGHKITVAGDAEAPIRAMSDEEVMERVMQLLVRAKARQLRGEKPRTGCGAVRS